MPEADDVLLRSVQLLHRFFTLIQQVHHRASTAFLRIRLPFGNFLVQQRKIPLMNCFVRVANEFKCQHRMFRRQQISQFRVHQFQQFLNG